MTLEQAQRAFRLQWGRAIEDLRRPLEEAVTRAGRGLFVPVIKEPTGPFRQFLMRDYERMRLDSQDRVAALKSAKIKLCEFETEIKNRNSPLQREIVARTWQRCDAVDPAILDVLRREQVRKDDVKRLLETVAELSHVTGEEHELLLPDAVKGKWSGTLVDTIRLTGRPFARITSDKGYSYALFPWLSDMVSHVGRPCWFWYDGLGRARFAPQFIARPPLARPAAKSENLGLAGGSS